MYKGRFTVRANALRRRTITEHAQKAIYRKLVITLHSPSEQKKLKIFNLFGIRWRMYLNLANHVNGFHL